MRLLVIATVLVVIASIAGWWYGLYSPARDQQLALETEIVTLEARESQLANQHQQLLSLQQRAPELRRSLDRLSQFIPPDPDQASFLELLQLAANASGITFTSLAFTEPQPVAGAPATSDPELVLGAITVTGTIHSSYFQLVDFLRRLEVEVPRAVLVQEISVGQAAAGFPTVTTTFQAQMFALIAASAVPTPDGVVPADPAPTPVPTPLPSPAATASPESPSTSTPDPSQSGSQGTVPAEAEGSQARPLPSDGSINPTGQPA